MKVSLSSPKFFRVGIPVALLISLFIINIIVHLGFSPAFKAMSTDSGVFAYCGARMLAGDVLYRDCWDNKPPLIYLINAFIVALAGQNPWGIWWFQLLWTTASSAVIFAVAWRVWRGWAPAALSTLLFIGTALSPFYYTGGNLTENYLLLPLALTAGALYAALTGGQARWMAVLGLLTAFAVMLKPSYFGMGAAAALTVVAFDLAHRAGKRALKNLACYALGLMLPLALTALVFWRLGALDDLWFAVFLHNHSYVQSGFSVSALKITLRMLFVDQPLAGLYWIALAAVVLFALGRILQKRRQPDAADRDVRAWWLGGLLLSLPMQMASIALSGKNFGHYFLEIIPALALLTSAWPAMLLGQTRPQFLRGAARVGLGLALLGLVAVWGKGLDVGSLIDVERLSATLQSPNLREYRPNDLEQYIQDHSQPDQSVLIWATHVDFNYVTGRRSPTRYIFPLHLLTQTMTGPSGFPELLSELKADPPELIVQQVVSSAGLPAFNAPADDLCNDCSAAARDGLLDLQEYIYANYDYATQIYDWQVYVRK